MLQNLHRLSLKARSRLRAKLLLGNDLLLTAWLHVMLLMLLVGWLVHQMKPTLQISSLPQIHLTAPHNLAAIVAKTRSKKSLQFQLGIAKLLEQIVRRILTMQKPR